MVNEKIVVPQRWMSRGEAVVEARGRKPLVVWGGIPGERSLVRVVGRGTNQEYGVWLSSGEPSPYRVDPGCAKLSACGGCPLLHVNEEGQEEARRRIVGEALISEGLEDVPISTFYRSPDGLKEYRYTIKVGMGFSERGRMRLGAWGRRTRNIVPIPDCPVTTPELRNTMKALSHHFMDMELAPYDAEREEGILRSAVIRQSKTTGEILITLIAAKFSHDLRELAERVATQVTSVVGIWVHINKDPGNSMFCRDEAGVIGVRPLVGKAEIEESINGINYRIGAGDFFQTNPSMANVLYRRVVEKLELRSGQAVIDLYCGVGGLALQAARVTGWALGVEEVDGAVFRARSSARQNGINAEFISGDVCEVLYDAKRRYTGTSPIVCVNPARSGLEEGVIEQIVEMGASKVAYISCNPKAMARDMALFKQFGYEIEPIEMFDMFPNTPHVECLSVLTKAGNEEPSKRAPRRKVVR